MIVVEITFFCLGCFAYALIWCNHLIKKDRIPTLTKEERLESEVNWLKTQKYDLQEKNAALEIENSLLKNKTEYR